MRPRFEPDQAVDILSRLPPIETHPLTAADLDQMVRNDRFTGPIEGLWAATDESELRLGIVSVGDGVGFVAVVLESPRSFWQPGMVKARFRTAADPRTFSVVWRAENWNELTGLASLTDNTLTVSVGRETLGFLKLSPSVTGGLRTNGGDRDTGFVQRAGTAFIVHPDGLLLTAHHVIDGATSISVSCNGEPAVLATVTSSSVATDLAILEASGELGTDSFLRLSSQRVPSLGDTVFTIGYPTPDLLGIDPKYTNGTVSALSGLRGDASFLQISVPIQPGNSGGALVNDDGDVIGVVVATASAPAFIRATDSIPQNINWAVKTAFASVLFEPPPTDRTPAVDSDTTVIERVTAATCLVRVTGPAQ